MPMENEKTTKELVDKSNEIIDSLKGFNVAEKYRIISSLYKSLRNTMEEEGMIILKDKGKN